MTPKFGIRALARACRVSPGHISRVMAGKTNPSIDLLHKIAILEGVTTQLLLAFLAERKEKYGITKE